MEQIIYNLINNFDFAYMLVINILTYNINKYTPIAYKVKEYLSKILIEI